MVTYNNLGMTSKSIKIGAKRFIAHILNVKKYVNDLIGQFEVHNIAKEMWDAL